MLPILFLTWSSILPICSGVINCRIACRHCRERLEHPDMLEVYCAMCEECKERRREWLEGAPSLLRVDGDEDVTNYGQQELLDDCQTTPVDELCDEPQRLTHTIRTTTTSSTTTTTTTHRPCPARPCIKPTRPPCYGIACPIPVPLCQMCPMQMGSFYTLMPSSIQPATEPAHTKLSGISSTTSELYTYLGVPKKLLKQLHLSDLRNS